LNTVEINNTFYRLPRANVLEGWASSVPEGFRFSIKASRRITHFKRLKPESQSETSYLVEATSVLGDAMGVLLMQLPPNFPADAERLQEYLEAAPTGVRMAFEFRHPSWLDDKVYELLSRHGHALCIADGDEMDTPAIATTNWGYLRLRRPDYTPEHLDQWERTIAAMDWEEAFVFFK